jgi:hypothetical protein
MGQHWQSLSERESRHNNALRPIAERLSVGGKIIRGG